MSGKAPQKSSWGNNVQNLPIFIGSVVHVHFVEQDLGASPNVPPNHNPRWNLSDNTNPKSRNDGMYNKSYKWLFRAHRREISMTDLILNREKLLMEILRFLLDFGVGTRGNRIVNVTWIQMHVSRAEYVGWRNRSLESFRIARFAQFISTVKVNG